MKRVRLEDLSLYNFIKNTVLQDFIETETTTLSYVSDESSVGSYVYQSSSTMIPSPTSAGRGWLYFDSPGDTTEQQSSVIVYDEFGSVISGSNYMVDYIDGRIITSSLGVVPDTVEYRWHYVSVVDEWPVAETSEAPIVVIDIAGFEKEGFQLGAGKRVPRIVNIDVFAIDTAERDDIMETLYDGIYLKCCPNQEFSKGTPIDWDGTFNTAYIYSTISGSSDLKFDDATARSIFVPLSSIPDRELMMLSDVNRYRGRIRCEMFHWDEGW